MVAVDPAELRELARISPAGLARLDDPNWILAPHIRLLIEKATRAIQNGTNLIVTMPPRAGKSLVCSRYLPAWALGTRPKDNVMVVGYGAKFAAEFGAKAREVMEAHGQELFGLRVSSRLKGADNWHVEVPDGRGGYRLGGAMYAVGAGGPVTGRGAGLIVVDDCIQNSEQAFSQTHRENLWDWWRTTLWTRREPGCAVVVVNTRWHVDDLTGRLLEQEPDRWEVLNIPALAEDDDPIGRAPGEALWPERFSREELLEVKRTQGSRIFSAMYQGQPADMEGNVYRREWLRTYRQPRPGFVQCADEMPERIADMRYRFATVDPAASVREQADPTCISAWGVNHTNNLILLDVHMERMQGPDIVPAMQRMVEKWDLSTVWIEKVGYQLALIQEASRHGLPVRELIADRDKLARALHATASFEAGQVWFPNPLAASWDVEAFIGQLLAFPAAKHDEASDVCSYAVRVFQDAVLKAASWWSDLAGDPDDYDDRENGPNAGFTPEAVQDGPRDPFDGFGPSDTTWHRNNRAAWRMN